MINLILQNRSPIIYGSGDQTRCFSDIVDCINPLDKLLFDPNITSEIVNIGPDEEPITINELYRIISNKLQFNKDPIYEHDRPNEVREAICSSEKARKILNYQTTISLEKSLDKVINYVKLNGTKKFQYNYEIEIINDVAPRTWIKKLF